MTTIWKPLTLGAVLSLSLNTASAAGVSHAGYSWDGVGDVVTGGGLEWLRWTETDGMSVIEAQAAYAAEGWVIASTDQMVSVFNAFDFGAPFEWNNSHAFQNHDVAWNAEEDPNPFDYFVDIFGETTSSPYVNSLPGDPRNEAWASYRDPINNFVYWVSVRDDWSYANGSPAYGHRAQMNDSVIAINSGQDHRAVAMVREATLTPVPLPAAVWLLASGLLGLLGLRRRNR